MRLRVLERRKSDDFPNLPAGEMLPVWLALESEIELTSRVARRCVPYRQFMTDHYQTAIARDELLNAGDEAQTFIRCGDGQGGFQETVVSKGHEARDAGMDSYFLERRSTR